MDIDTQQAKNNAARTLSEKQRCAIFSFILIGLMGLAFGVNSLSHQTSHANLTLQWQHILSGEYWRTLTAFFVHSNVAHVAMNVAGLILITWHWRHCLTLKNYTCTLLISALTVNIGYVALAPLTTEYFGFSALLYALITSNCLLNIRQEKWASIAILAAVSIAVLQPAFVDGAGQASHALIGVRVATESHLYGWLGGLIAGGALWFYEEKSGLSKLTVT